VRLSRFALDGRVLAFAAGVSIVTGIAFGLVPALTASSSSPQDALRDVRAQRGAVAPAAARSVFVAAEVCARDPFLLVGSALMLRSFDRVLDVDPGFRRNDLTNRARVPAEARYESQDAQRQFYRNLLGELDKLPGAQANGDDAGAVHRVLRELRLRHRRARRRAVPATAPSLAPLRLTEVPGHARHRPPRRARLHHRRRRPERGPGHHGQRRAGADLLRGESPVGRHVLLQQSKARAEGDRVVGDVRRARSSRRRSRRSTSPTRRIRSRILFIAVRTRATSGLAPALRAGVTAVDRNEPVDFIRPMPELLDETLVGRRINTLLLGLFGAMALLLALRHLRRHVVLGDAAGGKRLSCTPRLSGSFQSARSTRTTGPWHARLQPYETLSPSG